MANCSFINAADARNFARNNTLIWTEICGVQAAILAAIDANQYSTIVNDGTPFTSMQSILSVTVTNGGSGYNSLEATAVINDGGTGGAGATLVPVVTGTTITGFNITAPGAGYTPVNATATVTDPSEIDDAQDETDYDGVAGDGTFVAGDNYFVGEVITLSETSTITVDGINGTGFVTTAGQDETDYVGGGGNGSFVGGDGIGATAYAISNTITLNDGTIITVDNIDGNGDVTEFTVTSASTSSRAAGAVRTQIATSGSGSAFTLTPDTNNEIAVGSVTNFTVGSPGATPFFYPAILSQSSSTGFGSGFTLTPGANNISVLGGGVGAALTPIVAAGVITNVVINAAGTGYLVGAPVVFTHPNGVSATAIVNAVSGTGQILSVAITNAGSGYQQAVATVTVTAPGGLTPAVAFSGTVVTAAGAVTGISIQEGGTGYAPVGPLATITDPTGIGAILSVTEVAGVITAIDVTNGGFGYTLPVVVIDDNGTGGTLATATAEAGTNTFGTDPGYYYDVWIGQETDAVISDQIQYVLDYFTALGYNIRAQTNSATASTLQWQIIW